MQTTKQRIRKCSVVKVILRFIKCCIFANLAVKVLIHSRGYKNSLKGEVNSIKSQSKKEGLNNMNMHEKRIFKKCHIEVSTEIA